MGTRVRGWIDRQKAGCKGCMDGQKGRWVVVKQTDGWVYEWTDGQEGG